MHSYDPLVSWRVSLACSDWCLSWSLPVEALEAIESRRGGWAAGCFRVVVGCCCCLGGRGCRGAGAAGAESSVGVMVGCCGCLGARCCLLAADAGSAGSTAAALAFGGRGCLGARALEAAGDGTTSTSATTGILSLRLLLALEEEEEERAGAGAAGAVLKDVGTSLTTRTPWTLSLAVACRATGVVAPTAPSLPLDDDDDDDVGGSGRL